MTTFNRLLAALDGACLDALVSDGVLEGRQLDYKQALPVDAEKRDFLVDVTAFANTLGGDIVYGIRERRDADNRPTGEPDSIVGLPGLNYDATRLQLEAVLRDGVAPRIADIQMVPISRGIAEPCLVVRVPRSGAAPHMVTVGANRGRFYGRSPGGNYLLDVGELRMAFLSGATAVERLREFRTERITQIFNGRGPVELRSGALVIFHALPINPPESAWMNFRAIEAEAPLRWLAPMDGEPATFRHNLDGFVVHTLATHPNPNSYVQLLRSGGIEAGSGRLISGLDRQGARNYYPINIERAVIGAFSRFAGLWRLVGIDAPVMCALTLTGLQGCRFVTTGSFGFTEATVDRDPLFIPETIVQTLDPADAALRPLLDVLWNSGGWPGSPHYDDAGHWHDPARLA